MNSNDKYSRLSGKITLHTNLIYNHIMMKILGTVMLKTYTLYDRFDEQLSDTSGTVTFSVTDENSDNRNIFANTFLDENHVPQGVTASNKRELPLVEGLFRLEVGEKTTIDFKLYNDTSNCEDNKTSNQVAYDEVMRMQKERSFLGRIGRIFTSSKRKAIKETITS